MIIWSLTYKGQHEVLKYTESISVTDTNKHDKAAAKKLVSQFTNGIRAGKLNNDAALIP